MAKCRNCGTDIPDGAEYCGECLSKLNTARDSESYLDSLLNAVMSEEPKRREIAFPKKEASSLVSVSEKMEKDTEVFKQTEPEELFFSTEESEIADFFGEEEAKEEAFVEKDEPKPVLDEEDLPKAAWMDDFFVSPEEELPDLKNYSIFEDMDESTVNRMLDEELGGAFDWEPEEQSDTVEEVSTTEVSAIEDVFGIIEDERGEEAPEELVMKTPDVISSEEFDEASDLFSGVVETSEETPASEFEDFAALFGGLGEETQTEESSASEFGDLADLFGGVEEEPTEEEVPASEFGDFADLFGGMEEEPAEEEVPASEFGDFADLFGGMEEEPTEEEVPASEFGDFADLFGGMEAQPAEEEVSASEFGDFADLLGGTAATAEEESLPEFGDFNDLFGSEEASVKKKEEPSADDFADLFSAYDGESSDLFEFGAEPQEMDTPVEDKMPVPVSADREVLPTGRGKKEKPVKKEKKPGVVSRLYHKLFDNVKLDPSKIKQPPTKEELEAQKQAKLEEKERIKEEKELLRADKKAQKNQIKQEKERIKREAKAEKKARKLEEAKLLLEEMEQTRINRAGASIVFIFFAMLAVVILMGTSIYSYSVSIRNAEYEFKRKEYTLAYNEIYGLDVKNEDLLLHDRIVTVMYVQKQLNSYNNYYRMGDMPRALDSLLKGLMRYEKYIELAVELEIDSDLDSVRNKILKEINSSFSLSEQEAMELIQSDSQAEYSKRVYDVIEHLE